MVFFPIGKADEQEPEDEDGELQHRKYIPSSWRWCQAFDRHQHGWVKVEVVPGMSGL